MALIPDHTHTFTIPVASAEDIREGANTNAVVTPAGLAPFISRWDQKLTSVLEYALPGDTSISQAFSRAFASGIKALWLPPSEDPYVIERLTLSEGTILSAKGARFRIENNFSGRKTITIDIGAGTYIDCLDLESPGTESNRHAVYVREGTRIDYVKLRADSQRGGGGYISLNGSNIHLGYLDAEKIDRPLAVNAPSEDWVYNIYIGGGRIRDFVRGVRLALVDRFHVGTFHMSEMSPNADTGHFPGYNGILITGGRNGYVADQYISDAGEHNIRLSSGKSIIEADDPNDDIQTLIPNATQNVAMGNLFLKNSGGCGLKLNPDAGDTIDNVSIAGVFGVDIGRNVGQSNREFLRLSKVRRVRIGLATVTRQESADISCQVGVRLNNAQDVWIGSLVVDQSNLGAIVMDEDGDEGPGNISNIRITYLESSRKGAGNHILLDNVGYNVGGVFIEQARFPPLNSGDRLLRINGTTNVTGAIYLKAYVGGSEQPGFLISDETLVTVECEWNGMREIGKPSTFTWQGEWSFAQGLTVMADGGLQWPVLTSAPTSPAQNAFYCSDGSWGAAAGFNVWDGSTWKAITLA